MGRGLLTILLLIVSNSFMTLAWYGQLKFKTNTLLPKWGLFGIILISWCIAFFEYCFMIPANRIGFKDLGGPFSLVQLKVIQEVVTIMIFVIFSLIFFKTQTFNYNHLIVTGYAGSTLKVEKAGVAVVAEQTLASDNEDFDLSAESGRLVVTLDGVEYQIDANPAVTTL